MTVRKRRDGLKIAVEHVSVPDALERLMRAYRLLILRATAQAEEQAEEGSTGECPPDGEAKPDVSRDGGRS